MKHNMCIPIEKEVRHKLLILHMVKKRCFKENITISEIVNDALMEYFENHSDEISELMDKYHERGGCADL